MAKGQPAKGYKLTPSRIAILRALIAHGPIDDGQGHAVRTLRGHTGHRSTQALSTALEGLEHVGLVRRVVANQRTYRIEAVLDRLTVADRTLVEAAERPPAPSPVSVSGSRFRYKPYALTGPRVAVLRALLAGGRIDDPGGRALHMLMERMGRTDYAGTYAVVSGLVDAGLVHRRVENRRVVLLEAVPDGLSPSDQDRLWSTDAFPIEGGSARPRDRRRSDVGVGPATESVEVATLRAELAATRAELGRARLHLEMLRTWARRMPTFEPAEIASSPTLPPASAASSPSRISTEATDAYAERSVEGMALAASMVRRLAVATSFPRTTGLRSEEANRVVAESRAGASSGAGTTIPPPSFVETSSPSRGGTATTDEKL